MRQPFVLPVRRERMKEAGHDHHRNRHQANAFVCAARGRQAVRHGGCQVDELGEGRLQKERTAGARKSFGHAQTYLTPEMADKADKQAKEEHLSGAALIRKALAAYLANPSGQSTRIPQSA